MKHILAILPFIGPFLGTDLNSQQNAAGKTGKLVKITDDSELALFDNNEPAIESLWYIYWGMGKGNDVVEKFVPWIGAEYTEQLRSSNFHTFIGPFLIRP